MSCKLSEKCDNVFACNILRPNVELLGCNFYKPKKPMTEQEYLQSCNTEQLAKALKEMTDKCATCDTNQYDQRGECPFGICRNGVNEFVEWLKEKHE